MVEIYTYYLKNELFQLFRFLLPDSTSTPNPNSLPLTERVSLSDGALHIYLPSSVDSWWHSQSTIIPVREHLTYEVLWTKAQIIGSNHQKLIWKLQQKEYEEHHSKYCSPNTSVYLIGRKSGDHQEKVPKAELARDYQILWIHQQIEEIHEILCWQQGLIASLVSLNKKSKAEDLLPDN